MTVVKWDFGSSGGCRLSVANILLTRKINRLDREPGSPAPKGDAVKSLHAPVDSEVFRNAGGGYSSLDTRPPLVTGHLRV